MLLFKPEHVQPILDGRKTQTRRLWKRARAKVGSVHQCYTRPAWVSPPGEPFASIKVTGVRQERLGDIVHHDAKREGYPSINAYIDAFCAINKTPRSFAVLDQIVYVVDFELVGRLDRAVGK